MTELRYLPDEDDVTAFSDKVREATTEYLVLEGTYFYPEGGGQPGDRGHVSWDDGRATIDGVRKDHGEVRHDIETLEGELPSPGTAVEAEIDADRRERLSRMHTAQHVISRVVLDEYGGETAGNQIHEDRSRIDFAPVDFDDDDTQRIEHLANEAISANYPVSKGNRPRDEVEAAVDEGRALLHLIPDSVDPLRVVEIEGYDLCPCGGTHVRRLGEIGEISIVNRESKGADTDRIEFVLDPR